MCYVFRYFGIDLWLHYFVLCRSFFIVFVIYVFITFVFSLCSYFFSYLVRFLYVCLTCCI